MKENCESWFSDPKHAGSLLSELHRWWKSRQTKGMIIRPRLVFLRGLVD